MKPQCCNFILLSRRHDQLVGWLVAHAILQYCKHLVSRFASGTDKKDVPKSLFVQSVMHNQALKRLFIGPFCSFLFVCLPNRSRLATGLGYGGKFLF